jgi:hypothetical protein
MIFPSDGFYAQDSCIFIKLRGISLDLGEMINLPYTFEEIFITFFVMQSNHCYIKWQFMETKTNWDTIFCRLFLRVTYKILHCTIFLKLASSMKWKNRQWMRKHLHHKSFQSFFSLFLLFFHINWYSDQINAIHLFLSII